MWHNTSMSREKEPNLFVVGTHVDNSYSPDIQNAAYQAFELADDFYYGAMNLPKEDSLEGRKKMVGDFLQQTLLEGRVRGLSVTVPFKLDVLESGLVVAGDPSVRHIGATNTLVAAGDVWIGYNTDWQGIVGALEANDQPIEGQCVLQLGAGGTGMAAAYAGGRAGAEQVVIANRTLSSAQDLAESMSQLWPETWFQAVPLDNAPGSELARKLRTADIVINTTSIGQANTPGQGVSPLEGMIINDHVVLDAVYDPLVTPLIKQVQESSGGIAIQGIEMLIHQAIGQVYCFTGMRQEGELAFDSPDRRALARVMKGAFLQARQMREDPRTVRKPVPTWST